MVERDTGAGDAGRSTPHVPVLLQETMDLLGPRAGGVYVDCTVGHGGHSYEILRMSGPDGVVIGIDRDPSAIAMAQERLREFGNRFIPVRSNFERLVEIVRGAGRDTVDGMLFDFGVSSAQLDLPGRGFTYNVDAPLDMRMDPDQETTAADLVNEMEPGELARIIREYGEERWAFRIAQFIAQKRKIRPISTTAELVDVIKAAIPAAARRKGGHPARRTFQALRIATNRELEVIEKALRDAVGVTRRGGRVCAISFHSLEDRIVKRTFASMSRERVRLLTRKPAMPGREEIERNPRSRSARLRAVEIEGF
ncbi:MAG: 16S rRNA (cytosine(1402)-N(4))-methyltransferase RsmH [Firmicutes bacterium]|nr:16S rRNA (cytosine(1402)-N(4))-methyltransferase RsmH [Bacillota bacterium]